MKKHLRIIVMAFAAVIATSCNNEIFIDRNLELPDNSLLYIAGDDGHEEIEFQPKGLRHIYVDRISSRLSAFTYFDRDGKEIPADSPADRVSSIYYNDPFCEFSIGISGNMMYFSSQQNCLDEMIVTLELEYDHVTKCITIHIEPGQPMFLSSWDYKKEYSVENHFSSRTFRSTYENKGSVPVTVYVMPYRNGPQGLAKVTPYEHWADGKKIDMPLPSFDRYIEDSDPEWNYVSHGEIGIGEIVSYELPKGDVRVPVEVPANSTVQIVVDVTFMKAVFTGDLKFVAPVFGREHSTGFKCEVLEPDGYTINVI